MASPMPCGEREQYPCQTDRGLVSGKIEPSLVSPSQTPYGLLAERHRYVRMTSQVINELCTLDLADDCATARRHRRRAQGTVDDGHLTDQITAHPHRQERLIAVLKARYHLHERV
jgi:hypothetical protein